MAAAPASPPAPPAQPALWHYGPNRSSSASHYVHSVNSVKAIALFVPFGYFACPPSRPPAASQRRRKPWRRRMGSTLRPPVSLFAYLAYFAVKNSRLLLCPLHCNMSTSLKPARIFQAGSICLVPFRVIRAIRLSAIGSATAGGQISSFCWFPLSRFPAFRFGCGSTALCSLRQNIPSYSNGFGFVRVFRVVRGKNLGFSFVFFAFCGKILTVFICLSAAAFLAKVDARPALSAVKVLTCGSRVDTALKSENLILCESRPSVSPRPRTILRIASTGSNLKILPLCCSSTAQPSPGWCPTMRRSALAVTWPGCSLASNCRKTNRPPGNVT